MRDNDGLRRENASLKTRVEHVEGHNKSLIYLNEQLLQVRGIAAASTFYCVTGY